MRIKTIDLSGVTKDEQFSKFVEEVMEFLDAIINDDIENMKEEYCDILTAGAGLLLKCGVSNEEIERYYGSEHMEKLKKRGFKPRVK